MHRFPHPRNSGALNQRISDPCTCRGPAALVRVADRLGARLPGHAHGSGHAVPALPGALALERRPGAAVLPRRAHLGQALHNYCAGAVSVVHSYRSCAAPIAVIFSTVLAQYRCSTGTAAVKYQYNANAVPMYNIKAAPALRTVLPKYQVQCQVQYKRNAQIAPAQ